MKLHIFRLSGHDFVHYRKIEIGANDRAVYQQSISCFIVYANFDWFLIKLFEYSRKLAYVGMSRPKKLLCVAMQAKTYEKSKDVFVADWEIIDLRE